MKGGLVEMGVSIQQEEAEFYVAFSDRAAALKAGKPIHGHWVREGEGAACRDLAELFELWGYEVDEDDAGNITGIHSCAEKLGAELLMFNAIAPFVKAGSYIQMTSDHGGPWRWVFNGKTCKEKHAKVKW
jgi:hypothetical protein